MRTFICHLVFFFSTFFGYLTSQPFDRSPCPASQSAIHPSHHPIPTCKCTCQHLWTHLKVIELSHAIFYFNLTQTLLANRKQKTREKARNKNKNAKNFKRISKNKPKNEYPGNCRTF